MGKENIVYWPLALSTLSFLFAASCFC